MTSSTPHFSSQSVSVPAKVPKSQTQSGDRRPELLAPAGSWDCAKAAVENGADAVYFGLDRFNARMRAENFTEAELPELMGWLHRRGVKGYVTLNTLVFPKELAAAESYLKTMIAAGVDAAIVQDVGICQLIRHLSPDFPIHASTQMTVTSAAGVAFAKQAGAELVVLARECSLKDLHRIQSQLQTAAVSMPLEVFVHGALCVAYSGQCLTSEALGGRSANRGECAQACRMTYDLIADGRQVDLGDRQYLLSPQDLSGLPVLGDLVRAGVACLKIEGRLKTPEYVAGVTRTYRQALDRVMAEAVSGEKQLPERHKLGQWPTSYEVSVEERYALEMAFSRGLYTGWFQGIDNQALVHGRFAKKRGAYLGEVSAVRHQQVELVTKIPIQPGDGVVFDTGHPDSDQGGRVYSVERQSEKTLLGFGHRDINLDRVRPGTQLWKTSDPELDKRWRQSYSGEQPRFQQPIRVRVLGSEGEPLSAIAQALTGQFATTPQGHIAQSQSAMPLVAAHSRPLTTEKLMQQFARLGNTPFCLGELTNETAGAVMLPVSELNRIRRELVEQLLAQRARPRQWQLNASARYQDLLPARTKTEQNAQIIGLVRNLGQLQAALNAGMTTVYCEFEDPARYRDAVALGRADNAEIFVAPPRITKPGEQYILKQVRSAGASGYLVRNYDHLAFFSGGRCVGDFSLNVANPITAAYFVETYGLARLTASYDLNVGQLVALLSTAPSEWFEVTVHQHMPMFHMEHCVFCAFLSAGTDFTNCGRPCEKHDVKLRDRTGIEHVLTADAGCRNTVYNGTAQTGAESIHMLMHHGARRFRVEFLNESPQQVTQTIDCYQQLLRGKLTGKQLWQRLKLQNQLGVTRGTLERKSASRSK
ncbi:MAG: U32 family peptidase [Cyanobacteria bacterium J06554_6]